MGMGRHLGSHPPCVVRHGAGDGRKGGHPANVQDRDGALPVLKKARRLFPFVERVFATAAAVRELGVWRLEIAKRSDTAKGFEVLPKRWIVERTFGWLGRGRRLTKDFENLSRMALAFLRLAMRIDSKLLSDKEGALRKY